MKLLIVISLVIAIRAISYHEQWNQFKIKHGKIYKNILEEKERYQIFKNNLRQIERHNTRYAEGQETYYKGVNQFTDISPKEFRQMLNAIKPPTDLTKFAAYTPSRESNGIQNVPSSWDWRTQGVVSSVKNQGGCGSCWAFSSVGSLESNFALKYGVMYNLSAQDLIDCTYSSNPANDSGNMGCAGGYFHTSFLFVKDYGLETETDYSYEEKLGPCRHDLSKALNLSVVNYNYTTGTEEEMKIIVGSIGPISASINSNYIQMYAGGIFSNPNCSRAYNHAVNIVGYGSENGTDFWLLKNTWGSNWGEGGYLRLIRNVNMCGIKEYVTWPVII